AGEVEEPGRPHLGRVGFDVGVGPAQDHQAPGRASQAGKVGLGRLHRPFRVLVSGGGGKHEHLGPAARLQQVLVERAARTPLAPAHQRQRSVHDPQPTRASQASKRPVRLGDDERVARRASTPDLDLLRGGVGAEPPDCGQTGAVDAELTVLPVPGKGRGVVARRAFRRYEVVESASVVVLSAEEWAAVEGTILGQYAFRWGDEGGQRALALSIASFFNHSYTPNT